MRWTLLLKISICYGPENFVLVRNVDQLEAEAGANLHLAWTVGIDVSCEEIYAINAEALTRDVPVSDICMFQK